MSPSAVGCVARASASARRCVDACVSLYVARQLERLANALVDEKYKPGEVIIRQGQPGDYFYLLEACRDGVAS